jgi:hypothetical protein
MGRYGEDRVVFLQTNTQKLRMTRTLKAFETAVRRGELTHERCQCRVRQSRDQRCPAEVFAAHISNAVKRDVNLRDEDGERLYTISKEHKNSLRKIDAAMAAVLSWGARLDAVAKGLSGHSVYEDRGLLVV